MSVAMQNHINVCGWVLRRNVNQVKSESFPHKLDYQRPLGVAVAIAAYHRHLGTNRAQFIDDYLRANVAQMPDFIGPLSKCYDTSRQLIVSVCQNKNAERLLHCR